MVIKNKYYKLSLKLRYFASLLFLIKLHLDFSKILWESC